MNFVALREALRQARHQVPTERKGVRRVGMTLKEAAAASRLNLSTIHAIENVKREPMLKPELETIEALVLAYRLTLSAFFLQFEAGLQTVETGNDNSPPVDLSQAVVDDSFPQFESEERIQQTVLRTLARFAIAGLKEDTHERPTNYRLPPDTRPLAAESSRPARQPRPRHVPRKKKKRR